MNGPVKKILITGTPGIGKTTLVKKILTHVRHLNSAGFYTEEIRESGVRMGFELVDLNGKRSLLSHVRIKSPCRVGKYGVDVAGFDAFLDTVDFLNPRIDLILIDEIGKMECSSDKFIALMRKLLDSKKKIIAAIAQKGGGLIAEVKDRGDTKLYELTLKNRDRLAIEIVSALVL